VASFLFTPTEGRTVVIPVARITSGRRTGTAPALSLAVLPLPQELASTGAVGQGERSFFVEGNLRPQTMSQEVLIQGNEAQFSLRLSGRGNLNYLKIPPLEFTGAAVLSVQEVQDYAATLMGYEGYRQVNYLVVLEDARELGVTLLPFPYLDRDAGEAEPQVRRIPGSIRRFSLSPRGSLEAPDASPEPYAELLPARWEFLHQADFRRSKSLLLLLLPGPVFYLITLLLKKKPPRAPLALALVAALSSVVFLTCAAGTVGMTRQVHRLSDYSLCAEVYQTGNFDETLEVLSGFDADFGGRGFHHYNRSLTEYRRGNLSEALAEIHRGIRLSPLDGRLRALLVFLEAEGGIVNAYPPPAAVDIRLVFWLFALGLNLTAFFGGLNGLKPSGGVLVLCILTGSFTLCTAAAAVAAWTTFGAPRGLVYAAAENGALGEDPSAAVSAAEGGAAPPSEGAVYLKQIPREAAQDWLPLN
jgi:hypothetical protein